MKSFIAGQKAKISDLTDSKIFQIGLSVSAPANMAFDFVCLGLDKTEKLSDRRYILFNKQLSSPCGSVVARGLRDIDQELFDINLSTVAENIKKFLFVISVNDRGKMSQIYNGHIRIIANNSEIARFSFTGKDFKFERAIIAGELYCKDKVWRFGAVGSGFNDGMSALLKNYGAEQAFSLFQQPRFPQAPPPPPSVPSPAFSQRETTHSSNHPTLIQPVSAYQPPSRISLEQRGDKRVIALRQGQQLHVNLTWEGVSVAPAGGFWIGSSVGPVLDLGCMYRTQKGLHGVIEPLGGKLGSRDEEPFIFLDKQAIYETSGSGENLYIYHPELLDFVMLFAFIFQGARDFSTVRGKMLIREQGGSEIFIQPNFYKPNLILCSFSVIRKIGTNLEVVKEEQYFSNHEEAAQFYGFKL